MSLKTVAPYATKDLSVPIGQKIAISTNGGDNVTIWYQTDAGVSPVGWYVHDVIVNEQVLLGTFTGVQGVRIETQSSPALYNIGVSPTIGVGDASTLNGYVQDATATADTIALRDSNADIQANAFESTVATGTAPLTVASITKVANLNADLLDDLNTATASTASTIAARDASGNLTANVLISDVAGGTAPLTVTSTTKVTNLNADLLDDLNTATASTASTVAARDASGDLTANVLISDVAIGTAPLTVTSTTVVPNLNVDQTDGYDASETSTVSTLAARDASANLTANVLVSDVAIGTAPLTVTSTTVVPNLNVDQTDGYDVAEAATVSTIAARDASGDITANAFESTVATGTAPLTVASITKVANLNADLLDDLNSATASTASTIAARDASGNLTANVLISDVAGGTAPLTVTSTTVVPNLNADQTDGYDASETSTVNTLAARDASANLTANVLVSDVAIGTAPLTVTSTTVVPNLNVSSLGGLSASQFLRSDAGDEATGIITLSSSSQYPLTISGTNNGKIVLAGSTDPYIRFRESTTDKANITWNSTGYLGLKNQEDASELRVKDDLDFSLNGSDFYSIWHAGRDIYPLQGAATAKTTSTTLTAAEVNTGIITVNNGAAGTTTLTLPLATAMDSQFTGVAAGYSWDFSVINISTTAAEDADVGTNTGWTLVGNMDIEADDDPRARSSAKFRARKTGTGAWTLYRMA